MRVYRNKRDGFLYRIYTVVAPKSSTKVNGRLEASPCFPNQGEHMDKVNLCDFSLTSQDFRGGGLTG